MIPIGIIVNKLLTNIFKYAFSGKDIRFIEIILKVQKGNAILTIQDDGNGLPEDFDLKKHKGFGLMLIDLLAILREPLLDADPAHVDPTKHITLFIYGRK